MRILLVFLLLALLCIDGTNGHFQIRRLTSDVGQTTTDAVNGLGDLLDNLPGGEPSAGEDKAGAAKRRQQPLSNSTFADYPRLASKSSKK